MKTEDEDEVEDDSGEVLLQEVDQAVGGRVVRRHLGVVFQLRFDLLCQLLPQFNAADRRRAERVSLLGTPNMFLHQKITVSQMISDLFSDMLF